MSEPTDIQKLYPLVSYCRIDPLKYAQDLKEVLVTEFMIKNRIAQLAQDIYDQHAQSTDPKNLLGICILKGAEPFFDNLVQQLADLGVNVDSEYIEASSYDGEKSTKKVQYSDFDYTKARGRRVIAFDDIIETARTICPIRDQVMENKPRSFETAFLLSKDVTREPELEILINYLGFIIPQGKFAVGYGLDYKVGPIRRYYDLNCVGVLKDEVIKKIKEEARKEKNY